MGFSELRSSSPLFLETRLFDKGEKKNTFYDLKMCVKCFCRFEIYMLSVFIVPREVLVEFLVMS